MASHDSDRRRQKGVSTLSGRCWTNKTRSFQCLQTVVLPGRSPWSTNLSTGSFEERAKPSLLKSQSVKRMKTTNRSSAWGSWPFPPYPPRNGGSEAWAAHGADLGEVNGLPCCFAQRASHIEPLSLFIPPPCERAKAQASEQQCMVISSTPPGPHGFYSIYWLSPALGFRQCCSPLQFLQRIPYHHGHFRVQTAAGSQTTEGLRNEMLIWIKKKGNVMLL